MISALLFSPIVQTDTVWNVSYIDNIILDGVSDEWDMFGDSYYLFDNTTNMEARGDFEKSDIQIILKTAWNEKGIYYFIDWTDDFWDEKVIGIDSAAVLNNGNRMDRMYFYDNLKIQLWINDYNASIWFAPREESLQWHSLRAPGERTLNKQRMNAPKFSAKHKGKRVSIEAEVQWTEIGIDPNNIEDFKMMVLVSDSDAVDDSLGSKLKARNLRYISSRKAVELIED